MGGVDDSADGYNDWVADEVDAMSLDLFARELISTTETQEILCYWASFRLSAPLNWRIQLMKYAAIARLWAHIGRRVGTRPITEGELQSIFNMSHIDG
jgi:hypothetical protein